MGECIEVKVVVGVLTVELVLGKWVAVVVGVIKIVAELVVTVKVVILVVKEGFRGEGGVIFKVWFVVTIGPGSVKSSVIKVVAVVVIDVLFAVRITEVLVGFLILVDVLVDEIFQSSQQTVFICSASKLSIGGSLRS